ncbi:MAG: succinate dehydrogenase / fumarate reductase cytochrome b subunit [Brevundimonas sp.]|jgi:succinate dehydrogenase / fumarate reductase cytochrome b subunit|uniref:succinate dehydrogenase, cytochrome b556 subunit n=1 Tax=Brevundimonas sp. TaxID=1871086 RepID=UPI002487D22E|nr:succinate dehydrogenase, cytochrome b556 subunit [Brevundimonas sp.]MDI1281328.1 succinate dehydrogenase, cytochrome b556 subunit [Brevundimonas sp.]
MTSPLPVSGDDQSDRPVLQPNGRPRPLSPHLQVWRWHVTMAASILHRISGSALSAGAVLVGIWLLALACGPEVYATFTGLSASPLGLLVWFGLTLALTYHLASGIRHLVWDMGEGLEPKTASLLSSLSIWIGLLAGVAFWAWLFMSGSVAL